MSTDDEDEREAVAWLAAVTDEDLLAELGRRGLDNPDGIGEYAEQRARVERQRTLADARAAVQWETSAYPDASPAVVLGIRRGFDRWALGEYLTVADPDRRVCGECGRRHTQYEYEDEHRNDEGGY
jgi:hypothetical protein